MARTQLPTTLIADETIVRADLNVSASGSAVIRKLVQGTGITISSTGADSGTGDVTVSINSSSVVTSFNTRTGAVTLSSADVTTALGYTPYNSTNPSGYVSTNLYTADGTLSTARTVTQGANNITFTGSRASGTAFNITAVQTSANATDTADCAVTLDYTLTGSAAETQLVTRTFLLRSAHNRTSTTVTHMRVFNMQTSTAAGSITSNLDMIYLEQGTTAGTVTNSKGIILVNMQGTNQAAFVVSGLSGTNNTHLLLGTNVIPSGNWSMYSTNPAYNNYFAGNVLIGTNTNSGFKLDVVGSIRNNGTVTFTTLAATTTAQVLYYNSATGAVTYGAAPSGGGTLDTITTAGNTTTNGIIVGGLTVDTNTLYVDTTNKRVGIGTISPGDKFSIVDANNANIFGRITANGTNASAAWVAQNDQVDNVVYRVFGSAATGTQMGIALARSASLLANLGGGVGKFLVGTFSATDFVMGTSNAEKMRIVDSTGNLLIGTTTDSGAKLNINGSIRTSGAVTFASLPTATTTSVMYYNTSTGAVTYGAAPSTSYTHFNVTASYTETATGGTEVISVDTTAGAVTVTLPTAVGNTATLIFKKVAGSPALILDGAGTQTIDGGLTATINRIYESVTLVSNNSNWIII